MEPIPNIVRERLKAPGPGDHPDPDLLNAFAENALSERERGRVFEHVSRCGDCREVLALASPALEATTAAAAVCAGSFRGWFQWPALRWGAAALCVAVVGAAVLLQPRARHVAPATLAVHEERAAAPQSPVAQKADELRLNGAPGQAAPEMTRKIARLPESELSAELAAAAKSAPTRSAPAQTNESGLSGRSKLIAPSAGAVTGGTAGIRSEQAMAKERDLSSNLANDRREQAPGVPMVQSETVEVMAEAAPVITSSASAAADATQQKKALGKAKASPVPGPAAPAPSGATGAASAQAPSAAPVPRTAVAEDKQSAQAQSLAVNGRQYSQLTVLTARWTISAEGQLERSFDAGKTWERVFVTDNSRLDQVSTEVSNSSALRKPLSDKAKARIQPAPEGPPVFRAVCADGNDVWVGGAAGALYHSTDAGVHWTRIRPVAERVPLTADISAIEFTDQQHGKLTVSSAGAWVTADAGKTWQKQ